MSLHKHSRYNYFSGLYKNEWLNLFTNYIFITNSLHLLQMLVEIIVFQCKHCVMPRVRGSEPVGGPKQAARTRRGMFARGRLMQIKKRNKLGMKRNKRKVPGGCTGVAGWGRLEGCWLDRGPGCAAE